MRVRIFTYFNTSASSEKSSLARPRLTLKCSARLACGAARLAAPVCSLSSQLVTYVVHVVGRAPDRREIHEPSPSTIQTYSGQSANVKFEVKGNTCPSLTLWHRIPTCWGRLQCILWLLSLVLDSPSRSIPGPIRTLETSAKGTAFLPSA